MPNEGTESQFEATTIDRLLALGGYRYLYGGEIERDLRDGRLDTLTPQAFQTLMAALCRSYGTQLEAGADFLPVADRNSVSPTEIMTTTSSLLKAANLAVFELGMWQSWTGR